jgi:hypothetical protein
MASSKNSFINNAKERDFYLDINYLNLKGFKPSVTDVTITIDKKTENRPDYLLTNYMQIRIYGGYLH